MADTVKAEAQARGPWVLLATILGSSMAFIDGSVVNVALPTIQHDLKATAIDLQWVVESYALLLAALILVGGSLGDHYGRKRVFSIGVAIFAATSVWCGLAPDISQLIEARAAQGIGGALLVPGSLAIISASYPAAERGKAIGTWSGFTSVTTALGPVLGGWLVEHVSWRWAFFINIPLAVAVLVITTLRVPESRDEQAQALDIPGAVLATAGLGGVVYGLIESGNLGLGHPLVLGMIGGGLLLLVGFVVVEALSPHPMMPLTLFRSRTFSGANLLTLLLYAALGGALYYLPFNLQQVQGYSPTEAGFAFLPFTILLFTLSRWAGGLINRYGAKLPLVIGPTIAAVGFALFAIPGVGGGYWLSVLPATLVLGFGMAVTVAPLTTAVMGAVSSTRSGIASGINNAVSRMAGLLAIAIIGIFVLSTFGGSLDTRLAGLGLSPEVVRQIDAQKVRLAALEVPAGLDATQAAALKQAVKQSFVDSFRLAMLIGAGLALASALAAWLLIDGKSAKRKAEEGEGVQLKEQPATALAPLVREG